MGLAVEKKVELEDKIRSRFTFLYDDEQAERCLNILEDLLASYEFTADDSTHKRYGFDEHDAILITYGDVLQNKNQPDKPRLQLLESFLNNNLQELISTVHILPFFPSSSDGGFSVIDYKKVREELGDWDDVERIASEFKLMVDLVINHTSRYSEWFENYQQGKAPGKDYFIEVNPDTDLSQVTRPRSSPLLTTVKTDHGLRHVWTTFSDDQIDLDFSNPEVLLEFIDIFLFYCSKGARVIRLDAIAYLWKRIGTTSIHLDETHEVVKLFRDIVERIDPDITLITETNVPFEQNVSYFGNHDEAHMVYQFSLPPLLLHAILTENAQFLTRWAMDLPELPEDCIYFNFTASHDGIGVRPLEGLVPEEEFHYLIESTQARGGFVSYKKNPDGGQSPYELNITYFDAFEKPGNPRSDLQMKRYMCSQIIMLSLKGVPGIYFHNLTGTKNDLDGVMKSGKKRDINRKQWDWKELHERLDDPGHKCHRVFANYKNLLSERKKHPAFHPSASQQIYETDDRLFVFSREEVGGGEKILVVSNVSSEVVKINTEHFDDVDQQSDGMKDLLSGEVFFEGTVSKLEPFQTLWLLY